MRRAFGENDFQGRANVRFAQMSGHGRAIAPADHEMNVEGRLARRRLRDVTDEGCDLDLLAHRDRQVLLLVPIEVAQDDVTEVADRGGPCQTR